jgi:hypothetical protein
MGLQVREWCAASLVLLRGADIEVNGSIVDDEEVQ